MQKIYSTSTKESDFHELWQAAQTTENQRDAGVILETEGSVWKIQKRALFQYKKVKKGTPNLTSPYVHNFFTCFDKTIF